MTVLKRHAVLLAVLLAAAMLCMPEYSYEFGFDQGYYSAFADILLHGGVAYRDHFEIRPPGTTYVYYWTFLLFGRSQAAVRVVDILAVLLASWAVFHLGRHRFGSRGAGAAGALALPLIYNLTGYDHMAEPESFMLPFMMWGIVVLPAGPASWMRWTSTGLLLGMPILFKPTAGLVVLAVAACVLCDSRVAGSRLQRAKDGMRMLGGAALPSTLFVLYYAAQGLLPQLWDALVAYPAQYAALGYAQNGAGELLWMALRKTRHAYSIPAMGLAVLGAIRSVGLKAERPDVVRLLSAGTAAYASVLLQAKFYSSHFVIVIPFIALLIGLNVRWLPAPAPAAREPGPSSTRWILPILAALLFLGLVRSYALETAPYWRVVGSPAGTVLVEDVEYNSLLKVTADRIRQAAPEGAPIFVWGNEPMLYFLSGHPPAARYVETATVAALWSGRKREMELVEALKKRRPAVVVVAHGERMFHATGRIDDSRQFLDVFTDLRGFLEGHYEKREMLGNYALWMPSGR